VGNHEYQPARFFEYPPAQPLQTPITPESSPFTATFWPELLPAVTMVKYIVRTGWIIRTTI
jgi:hypothetical protein